MPRRKKRHTIAMIVTILFHVGLLVLFLMLYFKTPLPLPAEEGILVDFGYEQSGMGETEPMGQPEESQQAVEEKVPQETTESSPDDGVMTQDFEEAPVVEEEAVDEKTEEKQEPVEKPREEIKTDQEKESTDQEKQEGAEEEKPEEPEVDQRSLFPGVEEGDESRSEGVAGGEGNQGVEGGAPDADQYSGQPGGGGVSFSLNGRFPQSLPKPQYVCQKSGIVVVAITVEKTGRVVNANPGVKGSTTLDDCLLKEARKAALNARFDRRPEAPALQKGTVTYHFKLQ